MICILPGSVFILAEIYPIEVTHYTVALFEYLTMEVNGTMKHIAVFGFTYFEDEDRITS